MMDRDGMMGPCGICGRSWEWHVENTSGESGKGICDAPFLDAYQDFERLLDPENFVARKDLAMKWFSTETRTLVWHIPMLWDVVAGPTWIGYIDVPEDGHGNIYLEGPILTWINENREFLATLFEAREQYPGVR